MGATGRPGFAEAFVSPRLGLNGKLERLNAPIDRVLLAAVAMYNLRRACLLTGT